MEINAHCLGNGTFGILRTTFMLADLSDTVNPVGLACDWRVVLHELGGHGVLYDHVNGPNFGFAHSAGDSFGAVLSDPETRAPDRFLTFPWVGGVIDRRHDRPVAAAGPGAASTTSVDTVPSRSSAPRISASIDRSAAIPAKWRCATSLRVIWPT